MTKILRTSIVASVIVLSAVTGAGAQSGNGQTAAPRPDFTGIWIASAADISTLLLPGEEISLTPYGAERYKKVDMANAPSYKCLPYGPTRGLQSTNPFQIVQTRDLFTILTEHID